MTGGLAWGSRRAFWIVAAGSGAALVLAAVWMSMRWGGETGTVALADIASILFPMAGGIACLLTGRRAHRALASWFALAAACFAWGAGQVVWTYYELVAGRDVPFPSYADVGYLMLIPLAAAALAQFGGLARRTAPEIRTVLDGITLASGVLFVSWAFVLGPQYRSGTGSVLERAIGLAYPLGDIVLLTMALLVASRLPDEGKPPLRLIISGVIAIAISDSGFAYLTSHKIYATGGYLDLGWMAGFALIATAAAHPASQSALANPQAWRPSFQGVLLPYVVVLVGSAVAVWRISVSGNLEGFLVTVGIVVLLTIGARQLVTLFENVRLNRILEDANERLRRDEALRIELINAVVHDLANPLSPIQIQAALLRQDGVGLTDRQRRSLEIIERNASQLRSLLADFADLAKLQAGRLTTSTSEADLRRLAGEAVESFQAEADRRKVRLSWEDGPPAAVQADATRINQVLYNLLSNAMKFTPGGGEVRVRLRAEGRSWEVRVDDTGRGFEAESQPRLFKPFSQIHLRGEIPERGTGLGLYISRGIVEAHDGTVAASSPGRGLGSTFLFRLPMASSSTAPPTATGSGSGDGPLASPRRP